MINYNVDAKESTMLGNLPAGVYVGKILGAKIEQVKSSTGNFERLILQVDVTEGEHAGHYVKLYESQQGGQFAAKFKGVVRYNIPQVGSQYEKAQAAALGHLAFCLEDSNTSYKWDGDETKLKGLAIGLNVREKDWIMEQVGGLNHGTTTEIGRVESVKKVRAGDVKPMKKKELSDADRQKLEAAQSAANQEMTEVDDSDLPF